MLVLIPLKAGSRTNDLELRFALRSIEANLLDVTGICIVGHRPDWVQHIIHLPYQDISHHSFKQQNIFEKNLLSPEEYFLSTHDDVFFLKPIEAKCFPNYYWGTLQTTLSAFNPSNPYYKPLMNTTRVIPSGKYYDIHSPIIYSRSGLETLKSYNWKQDGQVLFKSLYGHHFINNGVPLPDCKIRKEEREDIVSVTRHRPFFSILTMTHAATEVLYQLFPEKSKYEND